MRWDVALVLATVSLACRPAFAAENRPITYDHKSGKTSVSHNKRLKAGELIQVDVVNTCPSQFEYALSGAPVEIHAMAGGRTAAGELGAASESAVYDPQYGVYLFTITSKADPVVCTEDGKPVDLKHPVTIVVQVEQADVWEVGQDVNSTYIFIKNYLGDP